MVGGWGWDREGQGQGLPLLPGKTLLAGANGFQTEDLGASSPGLLSCPLIWDLAQPLEKRWAGALSPRFCPSFISLFFLCGLEQVILPLCASIFPSVK